MSLRTLGPPIGEGTTAGSPIVVTRDQPVTIDHCRAELPA